MLSRSLSISYIDFLWALCGVLFLLLLIAKNEDKSKGNYIDPSQYLIEMTWGESSIDDVDLWIENPNGEIVQFRDREFGGMTIDTDNTGQNSFVREPNGDVRRVLGRREVGSIRTVIPGRYIVNVMMYGKREALPAKVKVTVRKLNPYSEITEKEVELVSTNEEKTIVSFELNDKGIVLSKDENEQYSLFARLRR